MQICPADLLIRVGDPVSIRWYLDKVGHPRNLRDLRRLRLRLRVGSALAPVAARGSPVADVRGKCQGFFGARSGETLGKKKFISSRVVICRAVGSLPPVKSV